jgi:hypothetical protein
MTTDDDDGCHIVVTATHPEVSIKVGAGNI